MFAYRERRPRAPAIAGVARVQFPTAGILEIKADLAMNALVGFATVPPGALVARMRSKLMPVSTTTPETNNPGNAVPIAPRALRRQGNPLER
jgi:hypothetical protein